MMRRGSFLVRGSRVREPSTGSARPVGRLRVHPHRPAVREDGTPRKAEHGLHGIRAGHQGQVLARRATGRRGHPLRQCRPAGRSRATHWPTCCCRWVRRPANSTAGPSWPARSRPPRACACPGPVCGRRGQAVRPPLLVLPALPGHGRVREMPHLPEATTGTAVAAATRRKHPLASECPAERPQRPRVRTGPGRRRPRRGPPA